MNYISVLERFKYDDGDTILERISKANKNDYQENRDIINEIVLWKLNRTPYIETSIIDKIYALASISTPIEAAENPYSLNVVIGLLNSKGVQLPMASTILHFYYPDIFPIIDQRAYRELYGEEYPRYIVKTEKLANIYMRYIRDCFLYQKTKCPEIPFSQIDKILYQIDKEKGNKVKY